MYSSRGKTRKPPRGGCILASIFKIRRTISSHIIRKTAFARRRKKVIYQSNWNLQVHYSYIDIIKMQTCNILVEPNYLNYVPKSIRSKRMRHRDAATNPPLRPITSHYTHHTITTFYHSHLDSQQQ